MPHPSKMFNIGSNPFGGTTIAPIEEQETRSV